MNVIDHYRKIGHDIIDEVCSERTVGVYFTSVSISNAPRFSRKWSVDDFPLVILSNPDIDGEYKLHAPVCNCCQKIAMKDEQNDVWYCPAHSDPEDF